MVRLLMLITSLAGGGAQRLVSELSLNLASSIQRGIVTLSSEISYPTKESTVSLNFDLSHREVLSIFRAVVIGTMRYGQFINKFSPDVSMSFLVLDNFINVLSNFGNRKTRVIVSVHTALSMKFRKSIVDRFAEFLVKILYNRADLVIAVSEGVRQELIRDFSIDPEKIRVIHNPVNVENIKRLAGEEANDEWFSDGLPILMNVGRLADSKGQWHLVRAFSKVRRRKQCRLVICGDGNLESYLQKLVRDLNLSRDVRFLGWQDNPFKYLSKASIFVSSSLWEALPYTLIEAMACGCPVIATDCKYGPSEILGNGQFGILIPPMDGRSHRPSDPLTPQEEYLANQIVRLLEDETLRGRYSEKAKERAMSFCGKTSITEYESIIQE